jgi:hypothetical protein
MSKSATAAAQAPAESVFVAGELLDVLTLIHAAFDLTATGGTLNDVGGNLMDRNSRLEALLIMARNKVAAAVNLV